MKKLVFLLTILLAPFFIQAQHCDSIDNHMVDGYSLQLDGGIIQLAEGNILVSVWQDTMVNSRPSPSLVKYYKVSRHGAMILDSVTYETPEWNDILMARLHDNGNPTYAQYCNVLVKKIIDQENRKTDLNLSFFDDDVHFNEAMEITVPLADTIIDLDDYQRYYSLIDHYNDLILQYSIPSRNEIHFDRFGLDGTLKHKTVIPYYIMPIYNIVIMEGLRVHGMKQSGESPLKYILYGVLGEETASSPKDFVCYELDSLFHIVNTLTVSPTNPNSYPYTHNTSNTTCLLGLDDGSKLVSRNIRWSDDICGTGIVKYDADGNIIKEIFFDSFNVTFTYGGLALSNCSGIDLQKDDQGHVYYAFQCTKDSVEYVAISKLDENLNIIWERYGMPIQQPAKFHRTECRLCVLDHGGAVVFGSNSWITGPLWPFGLFMMLVDDDGVGLSETTNTLRPYCFYPNPVNDQLHLHYSPDVTPSYAEIYDIQGRRVSKQSNNLESIDMSDLSTGTYTLRILMADGTAFSEKVVKQ